MRGDGIVLPVKGDEKLRISRFEHEKRRHH